MFHTCVYVCVYIYIYIYIEREIRLSLSLYIYTHICTYNLTDAMPRAYITLWEPLPPSSQVGPGEQLLWPVLLDSLAPCHLRAVLATGFIPVKVGVDVAPRLSYFGSRPHCSLTNTTLVHTLFALFTAALFAVLYFGWRPRCGLDPMLRSAGRIM